MKKDIHPDYVDTEVTCTCGATFTTRSTATSGTHPRRRVLAVPPVLHRQAEDPRHRRPRRPLRGPLRQEGSTKTPRSSCSRAPASRTRGRPALVICPHRIAEGQPGHRRGVMFEAVEGLVAEHAELEEQLAAPETHADARLAKRLNQRYAQLSSHHRCLAGLAGARRRPRGGPRAGGRGPGVRRGGRGAGRRQRATAEERLRHLLVPARPDRRQGRDPRGEVGGGRRGVGAVRRRPAAHVHPVRRGRAAGRSRSSTPPSPTSAATSRSPSR